MWSGWWLPPSLPSSEARSLSPPKPCSEGRDSQHRASESEDVIRTRRVALVGSTICFQHSSVLIGLGIVGTLRLALAFTGLYVNGYVRTARSV